MTVIELGTGRQRRHQEVLADGALLVRSAKGVRPTERALLDALPTGRSGSALVLNSAEAVTGMALRALNPGLAVHCHFDDAWDLDVASQTVERHPRLAPTLGIAPDPPPGPWDLVVVPFAQDGVLELLRERVRSAVGWLGAGGLLFASTSNRKDRTVRDEVKAAFGSASIVPGRSRSSGVVYIAPRPRTPKELKGPGERTFTVREGDREVTLVSRPGVFCHGRLDPGTRVLLSHLDVAEARRILDLGCGVGVLGIVAALRSSEAQVILVDSYARAVECTRRNAEANGVADRCEVALSADSLRDVEPAFGLVVTNPPYYGNYRISEMFLATAAKVLEPGGRLVVVTKGVAWHTARMQELFGSLERTDVGGYAILEATKGGTA